MILLMQKQKLIKI